MNKLNIIRIGTFVVCTFFLTCQIWAVDFVFFQPNAAFKDNKEAVTAIRSLEKYLSDKLGEPCKGHFFQKESDMVRFIESSKPAIVLLDIRFFVKNYEKENLKPIAIPERNGLTSTPAVVVVKQDSAAKNIFDMKGKVFATTGNDSVNDNFLSNMIFEQQLDVSTFFKTKFVDSSNSALMAVLYKEADLCVVDQFVLDSHPNKSEFKRLVTTDKVIFPPICIIETNTTAAMQAKIMSAFSALDHRKDAAEFGKSLGMDGWKTVSINDFDATIALLTKPFSSFAKKPVLSQQSGAVYRYTPSNVEISPEPVGIMVLSGSQQ